MPPRDILVHLDSDPVTPASERRRDYAISMAVAFKAHLTGLIFAYEPSYPTVVGAEIPFEILESQRKEAMRAAGQASEAFSRAAKAAGIGFETRIVSSSYGGAAARLASHGRVADLIVVGQPAAEEEVSAGSVFVEGALFDSGRPTLVVPHAGHAEARFTRALVAWDGGREAARAVHDALPLLMQADKIEVVVVGDRVAAARDGEPGADLALHLARHGLDATARHLSAGKGVGLTLLSHAREFGADFMVMGGFGHSRLREFILGGATSSILESTTVPVLMSH